MIEDTRHRQITCILPGGNGNDILQTLYEKGIYSASLNSARAYVRNPDRPNRFNQVEKDILVAVVESDEADEIFELIYREAEIGEKHGGFMYMGLDITASTYQLPFNAPLDIPSGRATP